MIGLFCFVLAVLALPSQSKFRLQAENAVLQHQFNVSRRRLHGRARFLYSNVSMVTINPAGPHDRRPATSGSSPIDGHFQSPSACRKGANKRHAKEATDTALRCRHTIVQRSETAATTCGDEEFFWERMPA